MTATALPAEVLARFQAHLAALVGNLPVALGIAVSGGPDSLALLLLAHQSAPGLIVAATVDHGLRTEAAAEARFVHALCDRLGIRHDILRPARPIVGNIQSQARIARYALLEQWRQDRGLDWVATAHHADDQAETLLMRMNRGSGVAGLSGVRKVNGRIVRPLLAWRRAELGQILASAGLEAVDDPSNSDERFDRARLRRSLGDADWIDPLAFARSADALAEAEESLEWMTSLLWSDRSRDEPAGLSLDIAGLPREIRRRLVRRAVDALSGGREVRGADIGRFIASLEEGRTATLGGVKGEGGDRWRFSLAPPRRTGGSAEP